MCSIEPQEIIEESKVVNEQIDISESLLSCIYCDKFLKSSQDLLDHLAFECGESSSEQLRQPLPASDFANCGGWSQIHVKQEMTNLQQQKDLSEIEIQDSFTDLQRKLESAKSEIVATNFEFVQVLEENDALKRSLQDKDQHIKKLMSQM